MYIQLLLLLNRNEEQGDCELSIELMSAFPK